MWVKVDDGFTEHQKVFVATQVLGGKHAYARIVSMAMQAKCYTARALTDGFLPEVTVSKFHDDKPLAVASVLVQVVLWEAVPGGYRIHDYHDYNPSASDVKDRRREDRDRQREHRERKKAERKARRSQDLSQRDNSVTEDLSRDLSQGLSQPCPDRPRARVPVPVPVPLPQQEQEQRTKAPAKTPAYPHPVEHRATHKLLCKLLKGIRDAEPDYTWTDLADALKTRCAELHMAYESEDIRKAIEAVETVREKSA